VSDLKGIMAWLTVKDPLGAIRDATRSEVCEALQLSVIEAEGLRASLATLTAENAELKADKCVYQAEPRGAFGLAEGWCATHDKGWVHCIGGRERFIQILQEHIEELEAENAELRNGREVIVEALEKAESNQRQAHYESEKTRARAQGIADAIAIVKSFVPGVK